MVGAPFGIKTYYGPEEEWLVIFIVSGRDLVHKTYFGSKREVSRESLEDAKSGQWLRLAIIKPSEFSQWKKDRRTRLMKNYIEGEKLHQFKSHMGKDIFQDFKETRICKDCGELMIVKMDSERKYCPSCVNKRSMKGREKDRLSHV